MIYIVGLSGKAGSGKDTLAAHLIDYVRSAGGLGKRVAFADKVKEYGARFFSNCDPILKDETSRKILQGVGNMFRDVEDENYWINKAYETILEDAAYKAPELTVFYFITDVRYKNEAQWVEKLNGFTTAVLRIDGRTSLTGTAAEHISETDLDDYNFQHRYNNVGSLDELFSFGEKLIQELVNDQ
jgi:hypothetical protein